jgi:hypothetical protein
MSDGDKGQNIEIGGDANSSTIVSGDRATIIIINYNYHEDIKVESVKYSDSIDSVESTLSEQDIQCPYKYLFHFGPDDSEFFYGRKVFIDELVDATQDRNFIPILGASGSGKSSVVFAGLVPELERLGYWKFTHFIPGADPFYALSLALIPLYITNLNDTERLAQTRQLATLLYEGKVQIADVLTQAQQYHPQKRILLIADQFEEIYTSCRNDKIRHRFLDVLLAGFESFSLSGKLSPVLVTTMRVDFLENTLSYPSFADVLRKADIKIRSMNRQELSEVIENPAHKLEVSFEAGLVERILDEVENQPGNLPLLEFALTELWKQRTGKQLTHVAYQAIGEIKGALANYADKEYQKFNEIDREQVRQIFIQLVCPGEGTEDTRRRATQAELGEISWDLVIRLANARLVVTSENAEQQNTVEVVHEALIQHWGTLREWMKTDRAFRAWQERLRGAKDRWLETKSDEGSLLRGAVLAEAEEKLKERPEDLKAEQEFIEQSIKERDRQKQEQEDRRRRDLKLSREITVGSLVAVLISISFGGTAWWQSRQAELNQADSLGQTASLLLSSEQQLDALIKAIKAGKILQKHKESNLKVIGSLDDAILEVRERKRFSHQKEVNSVAFSPDGNY